MTPMKVRSVAARSAALAAMCTLTLPVCAAAHTPHPQRRRALPHTAHPKRRPAPRATGPSARVVLTTAGLAYALTPMPSVPFGPLPAASTGPAGNVIHVDDTAQYQHVTGFGAAMTDSSAWLLYTQLPPPIRRLVMNALFSPAGIHLDFVRVPMAASDFTATSQPYSYDDVPSGQSDPDLAQFSIAHDQAYVIPALRQMLSINPGIEILANPWSPPAWMKSNGAFDNISGHGTLAPGSFGALARYFVKFIQAYAAAGIPISSITPQNEPGAVVPYPGLSLSEPDEANFIVNYLAPALSAAGLDPKIYGVDRGAALSYAQALLSGPAAPALSGIAWHCYGGLGTLAALAQLAPTVDQIVSECATAIIPYSPAEVGISSTRNGASAVALWNLALDPAGGPVQAPNFSCLGCTGVVTVSEQTHAATLTSSFYQFGQLSKFVQPGAVRIGSERFVSDFRLPNGTYGVTPGLDDVAFLNPDGSKVLVAYNGGATASRFAVAWHGRAFTYTLQRGATVTFVWH
jgi:glucosylceramidase